MTLLGEPEALEAGTEVMLSDEVRVAWNEQVRAVTEGCLTRCASMLMLHVRGIHRSLLKNSQQSFSISHSENTLMKD